jgi:nitroreductase
MKPFSNETVLAQLRWRYATKKFDPSRRITTNDWQTLEDALILTPSSFGLQPWKFVVITDQGTKDRLVAASWNQRQVADASHVVVFAIRRNLGAADIARHIQRVAHVRGVSETTLESSRQMMLSTLTSPRPGFDINHWATKQVYIALGNFMTTAAMLGVDTCPLEGIDPAQYDEILGLPQEGLATQVAAAAGYRAADDCYAQLPKVRFDAYDVIKHVGSNYQ